MTADDSWTLATVTSVPDVRHALIFSSDGLPSIRSESLSQDVADVLAAACSGLHSLAASVAAEHGADGKAVRQQMIEYDGGFLFLREAGPNGRLAVLTGASVDPGMLAQQMAVLVNQLGERVLSAPSRGGRLA